MNGKRTAALIAFLAAIYGTDAFLPNGDCSFLEYMSATMMCWDSLAFKLKFDGTPLGDPMSDRPAGDTNMGPYSGGNRDPYGGRGPYGGPQGWHTPPFRRRPNQAKILEIFTKSCTDGTISFAIKCQADVDKKCKGSLMDTARLRAIADEICTNIKDLPKLVNCVADVDGLLLMNCVRRVHWTQNDPNMMCRVVKSMRACFQSVFSDCDETLKPAMMKIFEGAAMDSCEKSTDVRKKTCSATEYTLTATMCFAPPVMDILLPIFDPSYMVNVKHDQQYRPPRYGPPMHGPGSRAMYAGNVFRQLCQNGNWTRSITCLNRVDQECGYSVINLVELQVVMDGYCKDFMSLPYLGSCVNGYSMHMMMECMRDYEWPDAEDGSVVGNLVCHMFSHYRECYNDMFDGCSNPPKSTMLSMFDLFIPKQCSENQHQANSPSCTVTEFLVSHTICWAKLGETIAMLPRRPSHYFLEQVQDLCEYDIHESLKCHEQAEKMCGYSMVNLRSVKMAVAATCKHVTKLTKLSECVTMNQMFMTLLCIKDITINVRPSDMACTITKRYMACFAKVLINCDDDVKQMMATYINMMVLEPCRAGTRLYAHIDLVPPPPTTVVVQMERTTEGVVAAGGKVTGSRLLPLLLGPVYLAHLASFM